jgi:hypothetical protein
MKPKIILCLALVLSGNLSRADETNDIASFSHVSAKESDPSEDALRSYLAQSDLVAVGEVVRTNRDYYHLGQFKVDEVIKGEPQSIVSFGYDIIYPGPTIEFPPGKMVLFLWRCQTRGSTNLEPFWRPRDWKYGAMPATPALVDSLKRIAATQNANSGEVQLEALIRRFAPNCTLRELRYKIGNQEYSTAVLNGPGLYSTLDRREMKWIATGPAETNITFMECPKLTGALWEYTKVKSDQDAEDYVKLIVGLSAGPRALEQWKFKAEPYHDTWLVTPTYVGSAAQARVVGPMEVLYMNREKGYADGIREHRPDFQPGQTAKIMRPADMNPDGLDPTPADLDDPTLDYYLSRCEMAVVGNLTSDENGGFSSGMALHSLGQFKVAETIKGKAAPGSTIHVEIVRRTFPVFKKEDKVVLFLNDRGTKTRNGTEWETCWTTDDLDFGVIPASPEVVTALKHLAAY